MTIGMPPHNLALGAPLHAEANPIRSVIERRQWTIVVIDKRTILRECLAQTILSWAAEVRMLSSVDDFSATASAAGCDVIILCGAGLPDIVDSLNALNRDGGLCPVLLVCDNCTPETVVNALELGVRGVVPTSSSLGILNGVISLILSGGVYVPPDSMITAQKAGAAPAAIPSAGQPFTPRQSAIISAIRKGRPNKIIAYELGMCESTVKVHIRNIMKKLKVRNRTELAFRASELNISP